MKRLVRRVSRDKDYRGVKTTVDWSHLVHMVRTRKPGALEVLQDAINEWFPTQFEKAKTEAKREASHTDHPWWVGFNARKARQRFLSVGRNARPDNHTPFVVVSMIRTSTILKHVAYVYKTRNIAKRNPFHKVYTPEEKAMRPNYAGSYRRAKIPILNYEFQGAWWKRNLRDILFVVRGKGSGLWAKNKEKILGTKWKTVGDDFAYAIVENEDLTVTARWKSKLPREGYRNKLKYSSHGLSRIVVQEKLRFHRSAGP